MLNSPKKNREKKIRKIFRLILSMRKNDEQEIEKNEFEAGKKFTTHLRSLI